MHERNTPALTTLLAFLAPGRPVGDAADLAALADAAAEVGMADAADARSAALALSAAAAWPRVRTEPGTPEALARLLGAEGPAAARDAAVSFERHPPRSFGPGAYSAQVTFDAATLRAAAAQTVCGAWAGSRFERAFGPMPDAVSRRLAVAAERPLISSLLLASAADALAREALSLAGRIPGSRPTPAGVLWRSDGRYGQELFDALRWLAMPGPAALATEVVVGCPDRASPWAATVAAEGPDASAAHVGETA